MNAEDPSDQIHSEFNCTATDLGKRRTLLVTRRIRSGYIPRAMRQRMDQRRGNLMLASSPPSRPARIRYLGPWHRRLLSARSTGLTLLSTSIAEPMAPPRMGRRITTLKHPVPPGLPRDQVTPRPVGCIGPVFRPNRLPWFFESSMRYRQRFHGYSWLSTRCSLPSSAIGRALRPNRMGHRPWDSEAAH